MTLREYYTGLFEEANFEARKEGKEPLDIAVFIELLPYIRASVNDELKSDEKHIVERMIREDGHYVAMAKLFRTAWASHKHGSSIRSLAVSRLSDADVSLLDSRLKINSIPEDFMDTKIPLQAFAVVILTLIETKTDDEFMDKIVEIAKRSVRLQQQVQPHMDLSNAIKNQKPQNN